MLTVARDDMPNMVPNFSAALATAALAVMVRRDAASRSATEQRYSELLAHDRGRDVDAFEPRENIGDEITVLGRPPLLRRSVVSSSARRRCSGKMGAGQRAVLPGNGSPRHFCIERCARSSPGLPPSREARLDHLMRSAARGWKTRASIGKQVAPSDTQHATFSASCCRAGSLRRFRTRSVCGQLPPLRRHRVSGQDGFADLDVLREELLAHAGPQIEVRPD